MINFRLVHLWAQTPALYVQAARRRNNVDVDNAHMCRKRASILRASGRNQNICTTQFASNGRFLGGPTGAQMSKQRYFDQGWGNYQSKRLDPSRKFLCSRTQRISITCVPRSDDLIIRSIAVAGVMGGDGLTDPAVQVASFGFCGSLRGL